MSADARTAYLTGGCQCGAVRYALYAEPSRIGLCHCRMCQKATAAPFGVFVEVPMREFAWTRGAPSRWQSSNRAYRVFCNACGTPLAFQPTERDAIEVLAGSLDHPEQAVPTYEVGREAKLAWLETLATMPGKTTLESMGAERAGRIVSYQHPDEDTETWSAKGGHR
jgi:hypothetical protein